MGGIAFSDVAVSGVGVCGACVGGLKFCVWAVFDKWSKPNQNI